MLKTMLMIFLGKNKDSLNSTVIEPRSSNVHPRIRELKELAATFGHNIESCPHCQIFFEKIPKRKTKCKSCGELIYPRTNQITGHKILLVEKELDLHSEMTAYKNGCWSLWFKEKNRLEESKKRVAKTLGADDWSTISDNDANWSDYNIQRIELANSWDWYNYARVTLDMLKILKNEKKLKKLNDLQFDYIYFWYNCDINYLKDPSSTKFTKLTPMQVSHLWDSDLDIDEYEELYLDFIKSSTYEGHFRFNGTECWKYFLVDLEDYKDYIGINSDN